MIILHISLPFRTFCKKKPLQAEMIPVKQKISMHGERKLALHVIVFVTSRLFLLERSERNPFRKFHANYTSSNWKTEACSQGFGAGASARK